MKKIILPIAIILPLFISNCGEKGCEILSQADLLFNEIEQFVSNDNNERTYNIIHTVLNSVVDAVCEDKVETAGSHTDEIPIEYSADGSFDSNTQIIDTRIVNADPLAANNNYEIVSQIVFAVDGSYRINGFIDVDSDVDERNENNNQSSVPITGARTNNNEGVSSITITVNNTGNSTPELDGDGKPVYIKSWDIIVKQ